MKKITRLIYLSSIMYFHQMPKSMPRAKYRGYDEAHMTGAIQAMEARISTREAARIYKIPKSTLLDRKNGR